MRIRENKSEAISDIMRDIATDLRHVGEALVNMFSTRWRTLLRRLFIGFWMLLFAAVFIAGSGTFLVLCIRDFVALSITGAAANNFAVNILSAVTCAIVGTLFILATMWTFRLGLSSNMDQDSPSAEKRDLVGSYVEINQLRKPAA